MSANRGTLYGRILDLLTIKSGESIDGITARDIKEALGGEPTLQQIGACLYSLKRSGQATKSKDKNLKGEYKWRYGPDNEHRVLTVDIPEPMNATVLEWYNMIRAMNRG